MATTSHPLWKTKKGIAMKTKKDAFRKGEQRAAALFISPFFLLFAVFGLLPIIFTLIVSFFNWDLLGEPQWIGGENYATLIQDPQLAVQHNQHLLAVLNSTANRCPCFGSDSQR